MTKEEFIRKVAKQTRLPMGEVADVVNAGHRVLEDALRAGERVSFPGFGAYETRARRGGTVRHVRTGKTVAYPSRTVAAFRPGAYLRHAAAGKRRR